MKVRNTIRMIAHPSLSIISLAILIGFYGVWPKPVAARGPSLDSSITKITPPKVDPKPPVPADSNKSAFAKLVVKNLGPTVNTKYNEFSPTVTADGRTMFLVSDRPDSSVGLQDFWVSTNPDNK